MLKSLLIIILVSLFSCKKKTAPTDISPNQIPYSEGMTTNYLSVNSIDRKYLVYRPTGITTLKSLVVVLHGGGGAGLGVAELGAHPLSVFRQVADTAKFILVYPEGSPDIQGNPGWNDCRGDDLSGSKGQDINFLYQLILKLTNELGLKGAPFLASLNLHVHTKNKYSLQTQIDS